MATAFFIVVLVGDYEEVQASIDNLEEKFGEIVEEVINSLKMSKIEVSTVVWELMKMLVILSKVSIKCFLKIISRYSGTVKTVKF